MRWAIGAISGWGDVSTLNPRSILAIALKRPHDVVRAWIFYLGHEHELAVHGIPLPKSRLTVVPMEEEAPRELAGKVLPG